MPESESIAPDGIRQDLGDDVALLAEAVLAAGAIAMDFYRNEPKVWTKAGNSPVSEADLAADRLLHQRLMGARPDYGWLSEETADTPRRLGCRRLFVVDPIDGTRSFIEGRPDWTVSLAVVEDERPIAAALYQPATQDLMLAAVGKGAWRAGNRLTASRRSDFRGAQFAGPRRFFGQQAEIAALGAMAQAVVGSLALRIAQVADGRSDAAFASANSHDWDLAAADLIVAEAGGRLADVSGELLVYNRPSPRHGALVAAGDGLFPACRELLGHFIAAGGHPHAV